MSEKASYERRKLSSSKKTDQAEWTVAIDLAAGEPSGLNLSQQEKLKSVHELAAKTKGKAVIVVLQEISQNPRYGEDGRAGQPLLLQHSLIKNGEMQKLGTSYSQGLAADTSSFLDMAARDYPAKNTGLFLHCHGYGNRGLSGDAGRASISEFVQSLKKTLSRHKMGKLDIVDLDCCLMAQDGVLAKVQTIASDLVASSEVEIAVAGNPAQNTKKAVEALLDSPGMSGKQLADEIVKQAKEGVNDSALWRLTTTPTLSHFDLQHNYRRFHSALDSLGTKLASVIADPRNKKRIEFLSATVPRLSALMMIPDQGCQQVDIKCFTQAIQASLKQRELNDPSGELKQAAQELLDSQAKLVVSYCGAKAGQIPRSWLDYSTLGGLNVFLPTGQLRELPAKDLSAFYEIQLLDNNKGWAKFINALSKDRKRNFTTP